MIKKGDNWMYLMVMFDLPVGTKEQTKEATQFRNFLLKQGFVMLQFSVYARFIKGMDYKQKYETALQNNLPKYGNIRSLIVTENQFKNMGFLLGKKTAQDRANVNQLTFVI